MGLTWDTKHPNCTLLHATDIHHNPSTTPQNEEKPQLDRNLAGTLQWSRRELNRHVVALRLCERIGGAWDYRGTKTVR